MYIQESVTLAGGYTTTNRYSKLRGNGITLAKPGSTEYREPDFLTNTTYADTSTEEGRGISQLKEVLGITGSNNEEVMKAFSDSLVEEYNTMIDSVIKYKGFYIGRYELTGTVENPTSKKGVVLTNQNWYVLKKACNNVSNNQYVQSCMIYGCQWDELMEWIIRSGAKSSEEVTSNSGSWGNYNGSVRETGSNETWKVNNIYDLAGNCDEWTQEAINTHSRVERGRKFGHFWF